VKTDTLTVLVDPIVVYGVGEDCMGRMLEIGDTIALGS
jgi:hypothetical protein